jgi:DNA-binding NtrC family response regulator
MLKRKYNQEAHVFFIDNDDSYIRDVLAGFEEVNEHNVKIYSRSKEFFEDFIDVEPSKRKVVIVFLATTLETDAENNDIDVIEVLKKIKQINPLSEVILYSEDDDINLVSSAFHYGAYTFIKKNENIILRIENNIKGIISQKTFLIKKNSSRIITIIFIVFLILTSITILFLYFLFPQLFTF